LVVLSSFDALMEGVKMHLKEEFDRIESLVLVILKRMCGTDTGCHRWCCATAAAKTKPTGVLCKLWVAAIALAGFSASCHN
jgi:hypothetical protein